MADLLGGVESLMTPNLVKETQQHKIVYFTIKECTILQILHKNVQFGLNFYNMGVTTHQRIHGLLICKS